MNVFCDESDTEARQRVHAKTSEDLNMGMASPK